MLTPRLALGALLLTLPVLSRAQTTAPAPAPPKFYVGLGTYSSQYQSLSGLYNGRVLVPVQLTAGYQPRPRLAVQLGVVYSGNSNRYDYAGRLYTDPAVPSTYFTDAGRNTARRVSASAQARYTLTRTASHHVQFDAVGGLGLEHQAYRSNGTRADSTRGSLTTLAYDSRRAYTNVLLILGPSVRYRFGQRVDLVYDLLLNSSFLSNNPYQIHGFTGSMALGLRYRFGPR